MQQILKFNNLILDTKKELKMNNTDFSPEEKKAKAQRVCEMFEAGHLELARNMLEGCADETWLFEELLEGCLINEGRLWRSAKLSRFKNGELIMLEIILKLPQNIESLSQYNIRKIKEIHLDINRENLTWYSSVISKLPKEIEICGGAEGLNTIREFTEMEAYALSRHIGNHSRLCLSSLCKLPNTPGHIELGKKLISGEDKGFNNGANLEEVCAPIAKLLIERDSQYVFFEKLSTLSPDVATELSKFKGRLNLEGLQKISAAVARELAKQEGVLILDGLVSLGAKTAEALGKHAGELHLNRLEKISDEEAKGLGDSSGELYLKGLTELSEKAAGYLSSKKSVLFLNGITTLTGSVAENLGNPNIAQLSLNSVQELSEAAARGISRVQGKLYLKGLKLLSDGAAQALSACNGQLFFYSLSALDDSPGHVALATKLASNGDEINLALLTSLSDEAAEVLGGYRGKLNLSSLAFLSDASARSLGRHVGGLDLSGLESLSDKAAGFISGNKGNLNLSGLKLLSGRGAAALSYHQGELDLSKVTNLTDLGVLAFFKHKGVVKLSCTTTISDKVAEILAVEPNPLYVPNIDCSKGTAGFVKLALRQNKINTLVNLSREGAQELLISMKEKLLDLSGLKILNGDVAELLATHSGELDFSGLNELSEIAAEHLGRHVGRLNLMGLTHLSDECFKHLSKHKGWISFYRIDSLSDVAAEYLSSHEGGLNFSRLKNISDIGNQHLDRHKGKIIR